MAQQSEAPEVETFNELLPTIQTAITMGVQPLATQAFSCRLITRQQLNTCTHMMYTPDEQATRFLGFIGTQVDANPAAALRSFRDILNSDSVYDYLVKKIDDSLKLHERAAKTKEQESPTTAKDSKKKQYA